MVSVGPVQEAGSPEDKATECLQVCSLVVAALTPQYMHTLQLARESVIAADTECKECETEGKAEKSLVEGATLTVGLAGNPSDRIKSFIATVNIAKDKVAEAAAGMHIHRDGAACKCIVCSQK